MNNIWLESAIAGLLVTLIITLVYRIFRQKVLFKGLTELYLQTLADKALLEKKIESLYQDIENLKLQNSDGFLKFISDSRDWAFQYIEEVQNALEEFDKEIAPRLEWARTFGSVTGETVHTNTIQTVSEAYEKLKKVLPKNNETPNN
jgi:hypothetical protein